MDIDPAKLDGTAKPAELDNTALADLLNTGERPRTANWSLRAALTRYAQPQPQRASDVIEALRRIEFALQPNLKVLEREGAGDADASVVGLLEALAELDRLADVLAAWAVDREGERPDDLVDTVVADVNRRLEALGVPREDGPPRPAGRARRG